VAQAARSDTGAARGPLRCHRDTISRLERGDGGVSLENVLRVLDGLALRETLTTSLDPYESHVGRLRSDERLPGQSGSPRVSSTGTAAARSSACGQHPSCERGASGTPRSILRKKVETVGIEPTSAIA
jgi:hypothetical protein